MSNSNIGGVVNFDTITARNITLPSSCVTNASIQAGAKIDYTKLTHKYQPVYRQTSTATAATDKQVVHYVIGATATLVSFSVAVRTANVGAATVVFDL